MNFQHLKKRSQEEFANLAQTKEFADWDAKKQASEPTLEEMKKVMGTNEFSEWRRAKDVQENTRAALEALMNSPEFAEWQQRDGGMESDGDEPKSENEEVKTEENEEGDGDVVIVVEGGVAYIGKCPSGVNIRIIDLDADDYEGWQEINSNLVIRKAMQEGRPLNSYELTI